MRYELRLRLLLFAFGAIVLLLSALLLVAWHVDRLSTVSLLVLEAVGCLLVGEQILHRIVTPLQTLTNVIAAIRTEDFSFRVRGATRGDAAGDLSMEINLLSASLQMQKGETVEARALVDRVLSTMTAPVLAFDESNRLAIANQAALKAFHLTRNSLGMDASELSLMRLLEAEDSSVLVSPLENTAFALSGHWMLRRSRFRLRGRSHTLLLLTEIGSALREQEREAWQRLIRVLGHEINNSLTPIQSIAETLQTRIDSLPADSEDLLGRDAQIRKGLSIIAARASSLTRFLDAYRNVSSLPPVHLGVVEAGEFLQRMALLEQRVTVSITSCDPDLRITMDPVLVEQALINLIKNAAEASLERAAALNETDLQPVELSCSHAAGAVSLEVRDRGLGIGNEANLFVPFYTTKPQGSGIGLLLSRRIAEAHGGTLELKNAADGPGCTARLTLPNALTTAGMSSQADQ